MRNQEADFSRVSELEKKRRKIDDALFKAIDLKTQRLEQLNNLSE